MSASVLPSMPTFPHHCPHVPHTQPALPYFLDALVVQFGSLAFNVVASALIYDIHVPEALDPYPSILPFHFFLLLPTLNSFPYSSIFF